MGSDAGVDRFSLIYKRRLNQKSALRFSVMAQLNKSEYISNDYRSYMTGYISASDTMRTLVNKRTPRHGTYHFNLGYERIFGKQKLKWFYGTDLILGYTPSSNHSNYIKYYYLNYYTSAQTINNHVDITSRTYAIGLSPFFGTKYPISKHFLISAQIGFDFEYRKQLSTSRQDYKTSEKYEISTFIIDGPGLINDLSIVYRF
jgi:hypothetical protein